MARLCSYHAAVPATMTCGQCGAPLCAQCTQMVGVVPACARCAPIILARQNQFAGVSTAAAQPTAPPQDADPYPLRQLYNQLASENQSVRDSQAAFGVVPEPIGAERPPVLGYFVAFALGTLLSIIMLKIAFNTPVGSAALALYPAIGYMIGRSISKNTGRGDAGSVLAAVGIMALSLIIGRIDFDVVDAAKAAGGAPHITSIDILAKLPGMFTPIHRVFIFLGLVTCGVSAAGLGRPSSGDPAH